MIQPPVDPLGNLLQPGISVLIRERMSRCHLVDVCLGMQGIAFFEGPAKPPRKEGGDRGLAGAGNTHQNQHNRFGQSTRRKVQRVHGAHLGSTLASEP